MRAQRAPRPGRGRGASSEARGVGRPRGLASSMDRGHRKGYRRAPHVQELLIAKSNSTLPSPFHCHSHKQVRGRGAMATDILNSPPSVPPTVRLRLLETGVQEPASLFLTFAKKLQPPASQFLSYRNREWAIFFASTNWCSTCEAGSHKKALMNSYM